MLRLKIGLRSIAVMFLFSFLFLSHICPAYSQITEDYVLQDFSAPRGFGWHLDSSGNTLVAGSPGTSNGGSQTHYQLGSIYIYEKDESGNFVFDQSIDPEDIFDNYDFGRNISISGDRIAVGLPLSEIDGIDKGVVYIYEKDENGIWQEVSVLNDGELDQASQFGSCVSLSGDRLLVTDQGVDPILIERRPGLAYIYERDQNGNWIQSAILPRVEPLDFTAFGFGCALDGDVAVIGAPAWNTAQGYGDIYKRDQLGSWNHVHRIVRADGEQWDQLGDDVDVSGNKVIVGIQNAYKIEPPTVPGGGILGFGTVYVIEEDESGVWNTTELSGSGDYETFGKAVAIDGNKAVVSAPGTGKAYTYIQAPDGSWVETNILISDGDVGFGQDVTVQPDDIYFVGTRDDEINVYNVFLSNINLLALDPSQAGVVNTLTVNNATPGADVRFIWGFAEEAYDGSSLCDGLEVGIFNYNELITVTANDDGVATFSTIVPEDFAGVSVVLQSIDMTTCTASNVINETFQDPPPPPPAFIFEGLYPSLVGLQNHLTVNNAMPNGDVAFIWGYTQTNQAQAQTRSAGDICPGFETTIVNPNTLVSVTADENGNASFLISLPESLLGLTVVVQAVDLASCTGSNITSETFGENPGPLVLTPLDPSIAGPGIINSYTVDNALSGEEVALFFSTQAGSQTIPQCPGLEIEMSNAQNIDTEIADEAGHVDGEVSFGGSTPGDFLPVFLQAVELNTCRKSNLVEQLL